MYTVKRKLETTCLKRQPLYTDH